MSGIDARMVCHHLSIDFIEKSMAQRKYNVCEEYKVTFNEELGKFKNVGFIFKFKYLT